MADVMGLRETLEAAMPGPWVADEMLSDPGEMHNVWRKNGSGYVAVAHDIAEFDDARLIALAPELAALCLANEPVIRWAATVACLEPNEEGVSVCDGECITCQAREQVARLDRLGKEQT